MPVALSTQPVIPSVLIQLLAAIHSKDKQSHSSLPSISFNHFLVFRIMLFEARDTLAIGYQGSGLGFFRGPVDDPYFYVCVLMLRYFLSSSVPNFFELLIQVVTDRATSEQ